ncbi:hypothetical protein PTI98_005822 [Pleurotus ostreatus]|nr:hypothetical protein PTI98_005822 [Pleurotus ostreatus]
MHYYHIVWKMLILGISFLRLRGLVFKQWPSGDKGHLSKHTYDVPNAIQHFAKGYCPAHVYREARQLSFTSKFLISTNSSPTCCGLVGLLVDFVFVRPHHLSPLIRSDDEGLLAAPRMEAYASIKASGHQARIRVHSLPRTRSHHLLHHCPPLQHDPPFVNPSTPIDPQLVLGFDVARHPEEMTVVEDDVWTRHPVVLYSKYYSAQSRSAKAQLTSLELNPAPTFIDVDTRDDASILAPILARLTETSELPILVIGGHVLRPASSSLGLDTLIESLHHSGELDAIMADAGAIVGGTHKVAVKQPVQADPRKPKVKKEMSEAERIFRGLISI